MKTDRLVSIINILNSKGRVTAKELSERFEVSVKTIQRDMDSISVIGIPIISYKGKNGGYEILEGYKIDKSVITKEQSNLLINLLKGLEEQYAGKELKNLIGKFEVEENNENRLIIDFSSWSKGDDLRRIISLIDNAIVNNNVIEFAYMNLSGEITKREIEPYNLVLKGMNWYLYGYCKLRKEMRIFKIRRIKELKVTCKCFEKIQRDPFLAKDWEGKLIELMLKFYAFDNFIIDEYFSEYKVLKCNENEKIIKVILPEDNYLYSMILGMGDLVEVIEPIEFRNKIIDKINKINQIYRIKSE